MREIVEDSALIYREELERLFALLVPGIIAGPVLVIIAATGLKAALAVVPILLLFYLGLYAANLTWAGSQLSSSAPAPGSMVLALLRRSPDLVISAGPLLLLLVAVSACGIVVADQGFSSISLLAALAGFAVAAHWFYRHAYELPLVIVYDANARQAADATERIDDEARQWTLRFLAVVAAPLLIAALISLWLAWAAVPLAGVAFFLLVLSLWMPFGSLCLVAACGQLLGESTTPRADLLQTADYT